jgi:hypothetical protein
VIMIIYNRAAGLHDQCALAPSPELIGVDLAHAQQHW